MYRKRRRSKVLNLKGLASEYSRKDADSLADFVSKFGAKGLAWIKVEEDGLKDQSRNSS